MKLAHDVKRSKIKKKSLFSPPPNHVADGSGMLSPVFDLSHDTQGPGLVTRKRGRWVTWRRMLTWMWPVIGTL